MNTPSNFGRRTARLILGAFLLACSGLIAGCGASDEDEGSSSNEALAASEHVVTTLVSQVGSLDSNATGVDSWDVVIVQNGNERYVVVIGFSEDAYARRSPVVELLVSKGSLGWEQAHVLKRAPNPNVPLRLSAEASAAMARDFASMRPKVERAVNAKCVGEQNAITAFGVLTGAALIGGAVVCSAVTAGTCAVLIAVGAGAGGAAIYNSKTREACPTR